MKRFFVIVAAICLSGPSVFGQLCSSADENQPVAVARLSKSQPITVSEFKAFVNSLGGPSRVGAEDRRKVLEAMGNRLLVCQAAESDKVTVSENDVNKAYDEQIKQAAAMLQQRNGAAPTDAEIEAEMAKSGLSKTLLKEQIRRALILQRYLLFKKGDMLQSIKPTADAEVKKLYDQTPKNKTIFEGGFVRPDAVGYNAILVPVIHPQTGAQLDKTKALEKANQLVRQIGGDPGKFDETLENSNKLNSGYMGAEGLILYKSPVVQAEAGIDFYNTAFRLKQGEVSKLLERSDGYYIIKAVKTLGQKTLELSDLLPDDLKMAIASFLVSVGVDPRAPITVKDYITINDTYRRQQEISRKAEEELVEEVKKRGQVQIMENVYNSIVW